jgi:Spy/CpxP family protein refolding chaperone
MRSLLRMTAVAALVAAGVAPAVAQASPYANETPRAIAALSAEETASLLDGAGMGFARAAELNGLPGPRHAIDMAADLHLERAQRDALNRIFERMQTRARALGTQIVSAERALDGLFRDGAATPAEVERRTVELGRLYGELRASHLNAHLETNAVLDPHQTDRYNELRGYGDDTPDAGSSDHGAHH